MDRERALQLYDEGRAAMGRSDLQTAVAKLQQSVALLPTAPSVAVLGECLLATSRYGEAIVHLTAALAMGVGSPPLRVLLARALNEVGERSDAIHHLRLAIEHNPDDREARSALRALLADPEIIARTANRHRLLHELRMAVPEVRLEGLSRPIDVLRSIGTYVALSIEIGRGHVLAPVFQFLNRLAVSPDQEVTDLLAGAVFPVLAQWQSTTKLAKQMLVGKGRAGFDDALALWGDPNPDAVALTIESLRDAYRFFAPDFLVEPTWRVEEAGAAFGRYLVERIMAGAADEQLTDPFRLLSRMGARRDELIHDIFESALEEMLASWQPRVGRTALRLLTGTARVTFERVL